MALRVRKSALQIKTETTEGVDPGAWATTDVLALTALSEAMNPETQQLNEFGGSLDQGETVTGAFKPILTARGAFRGSGTGAVPIAPFSALMTSSAFLESLKATTIPTAAAQTCTAGTANSVTFDPTTPGGWPTTTALGTAFNTGIIGEVVELAGNPAVPTWATIIDYTAAGATATATLSRNATDCGASGSVFTTATTIRRQLGTKWVAGSPSPHPSISARQFRDGIMNLFLGCRPNARFTATAGAFLEFEFAIGGQFTSRTDVAVPSAPTFLSPPVGVNGYCTFNGAGLLSVELAIKQFTLDMGNTGQYPDDLNAITGVQPYLIGGRKIKGTVDPLLTLVATRNILALVSAGTKGTLSLGFGPVSNYSGSVGNKLAITCPTTKFLDDTITEDNVVLRETVPFEPTSFDGGVILYHW